MRSLRALGGMPGMYMILFWKMTIIMHFQTQSEPRRPTNMAGASQKTLVCMWRRGTSPPPPPGHVTRDAAAKLGRGRAYACERRGSLGTTVRNIVGLPGGRQRRANRLDRGFLSGVARHGLDIRERALHMRLLRERFGVTWFRRRWRGSSHVGRCVQRRLACRGFRRSGLHAMQTRLVNG